MGDGQPKTYTIFQRPLVGHRWAMGRSRVGHRWSMGGPQVGHGWATSGQWEVWLINRKLIMFVPIGG